MLYGRCKHGNALPRVVTALAIACAVACMLPRALMAAENLLPLNAALLTRDLGDPRLPGNVKLVLGLPPELARMTANARPGDFRIYVHPVDLPREEGLTDRYRADGIYLWRNHNRIFLDARTVPAQEEEGLASVRIVFAPGGEPLAEGMAEGQLNYTSDLVDVVLAVDVSRSMLYNDPQKRRVTAARAFLDMAIQGGGIGRVGLVTFNHRSRRDVPLLPLEEGERIIRALDNVGADGLTNLDGPIQDGLAELENSRKPVIILLSDGKNEGSRYRDSHLEAAARGVRMFTVGLSEEADHELLKEMADATDGIYFRAVTDADLPEIYARLAAELGKRQLLHAGALESASGEKVYPVDGTVTRLVALADGGARVAAIGGGGMFTTGMSGVLMGRPEPGEWLFAWSNATPKVSTLALFGDTQFFLDVFPPQLLGDTLAVGATLARRDEALAGGSVWVEPLAGILPERMELFDDGLHGDGEAADGVYAGSTAVPNAPQRFDLTVRASGTAWAEGDFVRQTAGLAIKAPAAPPASSVKLGSDVDFGVLFPGETGSAMVGLELAAPEPKDLRLALSWKNAEASADDDWPEFESPLTLEPGRREFELEITIPETARPGSRTGVFRVGDGDEIDESSRARVTVGTVEFTAPEGVIDLGDVPPGTFVTREISIPYRADKAAALVVAADNEDVKAAAAGINTLAAGQGSIPLEITVSAPMDRAEGGYTATVRLTAGPGSAEIPLRWRVRQYAAPAPALEPMAGLPAAPDFPVDTAPLEKAPGVSDDLLNAVPAAPDDAAAQTASPWDSTEQLLRRPGDRPTDGASGLASPGGSGAFEFPETTRTGGDGASFWSAWWLYILAALLLLLLLLLLLAYLLYRLGKSALARFLLVSALANMLLMIVFILLLGTGASAPAARMTPISVNLVEEAAPVEVTLSPAEESLIAGTGSGMNAASAGASGGSIMNAGLTESALSQMERADASGGGGQLVEEKDARLPENDAPETEFADALQPSALPLEQNEARQLRRSERLPERAERTDELPAPELAEMTQSAASLSENESESESARNVNAVADANAELSEARVQIEAASPSERPVWSTGEKPVESPATDEGLLLAEAAGVQKITRDNTLRRLEPRGGRRNLEALPAATPEPRVEIDDPARDAEEFLSASVTVTEGDPGMEELRVDTRSTGTDEFGEKPGALLAPGVSRIADRDPNKLTGGFAVDSGSPELSRPAGGARSARGGASGAATANAQPGLAASAPGAANNVNASNNAANTANSANAGGANGSAEAIGEQRFDGAPSGAPGTAAAAATAGGDSVPGGTGGARTPATAAGGGGAGESPSPLASGGGGAEQSAYAPAAGSGNGASGTTTGPAGAAPRAGGRPGGSRSGRSGSGAPAGSDAVPGAGGGAATAQGGNGNNDGSADSSGRGRRGGTGEGRFDEMGGTDENSSVPGRRGGTVAPGGSSELSAAEGGTLGIVSYDSGEGEWKRLDRRQRPRTVAVAASAVDMDSLLLIVGDFARLPDAAAESLFTRFAQRLGHGLTVVERRLSPDDENLGDTLLALATPEQIASWSDAEVDKVAAYLEQGGHIWVDSADRARAETAMRRLAAATDGEFGGLPATHQLAENGDVDALFINNSGGDGAGDKLAAIATHRNWRADKTFIDSAAEDTMRFFVRTVNYFLSGDADSGIVLEPGDPVGDTLVQPYREIIPDTLSAAPSRNSAAERTAIWDEFGPETAAAWRMPPWSDTGAISSISDGQGGRALKIDLGAADKGRAAAYRALQPPQDFSGVSAVTFEAYYDGGGEAGLSMVFTVNDGGEWRDYETPQVRLETGWNKIRFDLDAADFRALTPGGADDGRLPAARAATGRAGFFLYRSGNSAAIALVRDLRLVRK